MTRILMRIFPNAIGTYTRQGSGLSHNEVIIWNRSINEKLQQARKRKANNTRNGHRFRFRTNGIKPSFSLNE